MGGPGEGSPGVQAEAEQLLNALSTQRPDLLKGLMNLLQGGGAGATMMGTKPGANMMRLGDMAERDGDQIPPPQNRRY